MGRLIVLDGLDGSGKETQSKIIEKTLIERKYNVNRISYPNYDEESSALVKLYLSGKIFKNLFKINSFAATSFYACDHYITYEKNWKRFYIKNNVIVADRYVSSNAIHQMSKLNRSEWEDFLNWLYDYEIIKLGLPKEDLLIYLDVDPEISKELVEKRNLSKDIHEENFEYMKVCRTAALFSAEKLGWKILNCCRNGKMLKIEEIAKKIETLVLNFLEKGV